MKEVQRKKHEFASAEESIWGVLKGRSRWRKASPKAVRKVHQVIQRASLSMVSHVCLNASASFIQVSAILQTSPTQSTCAGWIFWENYSPTSLPNRQSVAKTFTLSHCVEARCLLCKNTPTTSRLLESGVKFPPQNCCQFITTVCVCSGVVRTGLFVNWLIFPAGSASAMLAHGKTSTALGSFALLCAARTCSRMQLAVLVEKKTMCAGELWNGKWNIKTR